MNKDANLAIVIPAYKAAFLRDTLESIAAQSCQNFTLYIGNDASPEDLYQIVASFSERTTIVYTKFENNLGGVDLVSHWKRCIELTRNEEWIWLFSDDDIMQKECVESFYAYIQGNSKVDLVHFNMSFIDFEGRVTKVCNDFPKKLNVTDFFSKRTKFQINSTVVEYIFSKKVYEQEGGFTNNDLAWCADDATWIRFGRVNGISTISGPRVLWRNSGLNISANVKDKGIVIRKVNANVNHVKWAIQYFKDNGLKASTSTFERLKWAISTMVITSSFSVIKKHQMMNKAAKEIGYTGLSGITYLFYREVKNLTNIIKKF
ncbi:MAG: glycosyltransferase family 2 protein [Flavobacterium sp.]|nr:MAG: glycosyltransferase family 2 protein [Flavobacterium sp.]